MPVKLIVGLGNPGRRYGKTPHNIGYEVVDELARRWGCRFVDSAKARAQTAETSSSDETILLAKPTTYMNLSGEAVRDLMKNRPLEIEDILIIYDEAQLEVGRLRIRGEGSAGGHNGLRSIIACLGSENFARLRIGIKPDFDTDGLRDYVLSIPPPEIRIRLSNMVDVAADAAEHWIERGSAETANRFNGYREPEAK
jgi:PTH1 family peptidyl-tRNA hydrolase